jgi:NAD+ synthase (glutamine-hydrolysing)
MEIHQFLDPCTFGYFRVAAVSTEVAIGNPLENAKRHKFMLEQLAEKYVDYAVFPELSLTGYSCGDLFFSQALIRDAEKLLAWLVFSCPRGIVATIGLPIVYGDNLFNCAVTFTHGSILGIVPKSYLPNYREFYEKRHFAASEDLPRRATINLCDQKNIPFGIDLIFADVNTPAKIFTSICEDDWVPIPYSRQAALAGANILANSSASDITIGKNEFRRALMTVQSGTCLCAQLYTSAVGESTSDLCWDGQGLICERGSLLCESELFHRGSCLISDISLATLIADRMQQGSFRDNARHNQSEFRLIEFEQGYSAQRSDFFRQVDPHPFVPSDPATLNDRCRQTFNIQAHALIERLENLPAHLRKVIIGLSGGSDSTLALLVAVHAFDKLKLSRRDIICVTMPGFGTTAGTKSNAIALAEALDVTLREISIKESSELRFKQVGYDVAKAFAEKNTLPFENVQAWDRTDILFAISCVDGGIVLGTGDLSELALGWCTYKGDHMSHYAVNCGVPKTLVIHLIKWAAKNVYDGEKEVVEVLRRIAETPISPELLPAEDGQIVQKSEEKNGPYELHDFTLYCFIRFGLEPVHIARLCLEAFQGKYEIGEIKKWMKIFFLSFFRNQFKRNCVPDGPKVGLTALSPRGDWRMPSDADVKAWLRNWAEIPDTIIKTEKKAPELRGN